LYQSRAWLLWLMLLVRPTTLDAVVFGHLTPMHRAPFVNSSLQHHLKSCRNLVAFCQRISADYFPLSPEGTLPISALFIVHLSLFHRLSDAAVPLPFRPCNSALCGSCPLVTPYYCRLGDLCFVFMSAYCMFDLPVYYLFLQYFDTVGWVF